MAKIMRGYVERMGNAAKGTRCVVPVLHLAPLFATLPSNPPSLFLPAAADQMCGSDVMFHRFSHDGIRVQDDDTPESLGIEDGEGLGAF